MYNRSMRPAIFLDRDGVIIENKPDYIRSRADITFFSQALAALARLKDSRYKIVIVTNQSGVGRGLFSMDLAHELNARVVEAITAHGGRIDGVYMCPHDPAENCACRKPEPGLLLRAATDLDLDLNRSIMIGDALSDVEAGIRAGVMKSALVLTGRGKQQLASPEAGRFKSLLIYDSLEIALTDLIPVLQPGKD